MSELLCSADTVSSDVYVRHSARKTVFSWTVGQWLAGLSFNQGVGGSIPALVDVYLGKMYSYFI